MAFVAIDKDGAEAIYQDKPMRKNNQWTYLCGEETVYVPEGSIEKLIGKKLTWEDEPVELKENSRIG